VAAHGETRPGHPQIRSSSGTASHIARCATSHKARPRR
jgi:hypothetical protein